MGFGNELARLGVVAGFGNGVLLVDFAVYFPYMNQDSLLLEASLSTGPRGTGDVFDMMAVSMLNYRFPNHGYICMSRKYGRKLCKVGCPVDMPYEALSGYRYLNLGYGFGEEIARMCIPIEISTTDAAPCAHIEIMLKLKDPNNPMLCLTTFEPLDRDGCWNTHRYQLHEAEDCDASFTQLTSDDMLEDAQASGFVLFNETVKTYSCAPDNMCVELR